MQISCGRILVAGYSEVAPKKKPDTYPQKRSVTFPPIGRNNCLFKSDCWLPRGVNGSSDHIDGAPTGHPPDPRPKPYAASVAGSRPGRSAPCLET